MSRGKVNYSRRLTIRLSEAEHDSFMETKRNSGLSVSELVRESVKFYSFSYPSDNGKLDNNNQRGAKKAD